MAVSRKLHLSPSVDLDTLADQTEGYSGADIQAVMYNAHLEVVHENIAKVPALNKLSIHDDEVPVEFVVLRNRKKGQNTSLSRTEQTALQKRVRANCCNWDFQQIIHDSCFQLRRIIDNCRDKNHSETSLRNPDRGEEVETKLKVNNTMLSILLLFWNVRPQHEIQQIHINKVLKTTRPSVPPKERIRLERMWVVLVFHIHELWTLSHFTDTRHLSRTGAEDCLRLPILEELETVCPWDDILLLWKVLSLVNIHLEVCTDNGGEKCPNRIFNYISMICLTLYPSRLM